MRIIVSGSRDWVDREQVRAFLYTLHEGDTIIEGGALGLDRLVRETIRGEGWPFWVETHWAPWQWLGKPAGSQRNGRMVQAGADLAAIFPLEGSVGTWDLKHRAEAAGITVVRGDRTE